MKKKLCILIIGFIFTGWLYFKGDHKTSISELSLCNIEALAQAEGPGHRFCYGSGSLDCSGAKVKMIVAHIK